MKYELLHETGGVRTFVVILDPDDEALACLREIAVKEDLDAAQISAIGAFREATLAFFDWETKAYLDIPVNEQTEVASMTGDIATGPDGSPAVHVHAVLGRRDGTAIAGHLSKGIVRPTLEILITESPAHLARRHDPATGLTLIRPR
ncbi:MAG: PPC domain-containing DNA-binding protein [Bauldia sp.]